MKKLLLLISSIFIIGAAFSQTYNPIYGKQDFRDTVKLSKLKNNAGLNYILSTDTAGRIIKVINPNGTPFCTTALLSGSIIWVNGFNFSNTKLTYQIGCQLDTASASNFSITAADTSDRYTIVWADTLGHLGTTDGTTGAVASIPTVDPRSQILLATYFIPANSTQPSLVSNTTVYKENIGGEWTGGSNIIESNFSYPYVPYQGLVSTYIPGHIYNDYFAYSNGEDNSFSNYSYLSFYIKVIGSMPTTENIYIAFTTPSGYVRYTSLKSGQYGFISTITDTWELVVIPISALTISAVGNTFNSIVFSFSQTGGALQFDNIILQTGGNSQSSTGVKSVNGQTDNVTIRQKYNSDSSYVILEVNGVNTDSLGQRIDTLTASTGISIVTTGRNHAISATGGGGSSQFRDTTNGIYLPDAIGGLALGTQKNYTGTKLLVDGSGLFTGGNNDPGDSSPKGVRIGFNKDDDYGFIQSMQTATSYKDLVVQDGSANTGFGKRPVYKVDVKGDANIDSTFSYKINGVNVARAQTFLGNFYFGNSGNLTGTGIRNTATGQLALENLTRGNYNTAIGHGAMRNTTSASHNTAIGGDALNANSEGFDNTAIGVDALYRNGVGESNVAVGNNSLVYNYNGNQNNALGSSALFSNIAGSLNTAIGDASLYNSLGHWNTAIGANALRSITTGNRNTALGYRAGDTSAQKVDVINSIAIGANSFATKSYKAVFGNDSTLETYLHGKVGINTNDPSEDLDVYRDYPNKSLIKVGNYYSYLHLGTIGDYAGLWYNEPTPSASNYIFQPGPDRVFFNTPSTGGSGYISFRINNSDRVKIQENGSVGIATTMPDQSAYLDVQGIYKGFKPPVMTDAQMRAIYLPIAGLVVSNSDSLNRIFIYTGTAWKGLAFTDEASSGTTSYQTQTASGSTTFTFTSVPSSYDDYIVFVNGAAIRPTTDYTTSGNIVTISTIISGDIVRFQRIK